MGAFAFDLTSEPGVIRMVLKGSFDAVQMRDFVVAHNRAVDSMAGRPYRVWVDIRELVPISPECAQIVEEAKRYSATRPTFRGSAVLVASATVALQHRRTSVSGGVMDSELISNDEAELRAHLAKVNRRT